MSRRSQAVPAFVLCGLFLILLMAPARPAGAQKADWAKAAGDHRSESRTLKSSKGGVDAEEGWIAVPERRGAPGTRLIEIHYLRLKSKASSPRAPLVFLAGGPGSRGVSDTPATVDFWAPFLAVGDVVLFDQRGTRDPDLDWSWDGPLPLEFFQNAEKARAHMVELSRKGAEAMRARGVDLAGYTTVESADDLEALRTVLGAPKISLLGFSYGTHLACSYLRRHDAYAENAILIGTEGPDFTDKLPYSMDTQLRKIGRMAAADAKVGPQVPDLMALLDRVDQKLAREPMMVKIPKPGGGDVSLPVGPFGLHFIMRVDVGDATDLPVFPRLLWSIDHGDPSILTWFIAKRSPIAVRVSGMGYAMDAASGASPGRRALIASQADSRFADVVNFPFPDIAPAWGAPDLGAEFRSPLVTSVRTLFMSGDLDWNTPPYQAEEIKWGFTNATHLVVPNAGHEQVWLQNPATTPILVDFLAGKDVSDRHPGYPPLRFMKLEGEDSEVRHPAVSR